LDIAATVDYGPLVPALVAPLVGFALGVLLASICRGEAPRDGDSDGLARAKVAGLFAVLVYAPVCAWFIVFAGDWAIFYLDDSRAVPSALWLVLIVLDTVAVVAGFTVAYRAARRRADRTLLALGAGPAALALALVLWFVARLRVDGTFHQVSASFGTRPVAGGPLGYAVLWMGAMTVAGMVVAARALAGRLPSAPRSRWGTGSQAGEPPKPPPQAFAPADAGPSGERPALLGRQRRRSSPDPRSER
jgi:hypothetical protein